jgi:hypothetical protein
MLVIRVCLFSASSSLSTNVRFVASPLFVPLSSGVSKRVLTFPCQRELEMERTNVKDLWLWLFVALQSLLKPYGYFGSFDVSTML